MLTNYHTHSVFCDGKSTPEAVVQSALKKGFSALGFSSHGLTPFDHRYCVEDTEAYIACVEELKRRYNGQIRIWLGVEEDAWSWMDRSRFDYIIGSCHYIFVEGKYLSVDSGPEFWDECQQACGGDPVRVAETYYRCFCEYIERRKPDIIGHFDLITKYEEIREPRLLNNARYRKVALRYLERAAATGCLFEVNLGAMIRGLRTAPYPSEDLLFRLKKLNAGILLSSDSHHADTLDQGFDEMRARLREIGFRDTFYFDGYEFVKTAL